MKRFDRVGFRQRHSPYHVKAKFTKAIEEKRTEIKRKHIIDRDHPVFEDKRKYLIFVFVSKSTRSTS